MRRSPEHDLRRSYRLRFLASLAASLLALLGVVHFWPAPANDPPEITYSTNGRESVQIENVQPTRHGQETPPPPPAPLPPVIYPEEERLEPFELDLSQNQLELNPSPPEPSDAGTPSDGKTAKQVEVGPRPVRFVEPEYTANARNDNVRASVTVRVLVDKFGHVKKATITERHLLDEDRETKQHVSQLGYGLEEAALAAARRWQFRPARQDGSAVQSYTSLTLNFGI